MGKHHVKRRLVQLFCAALYNANLEGFKDRTIYKGDSKGVCVPGLHCYSCPGAVGACPIGSLQNAISSKSPGMLFYVLGTLLLFGVFLGRTVCGYLCPFGLLQELLHKIPSPKLKKSRVTKALSKVKYVVLAGLVVLLPLVLSIKNGVPVPSFCKYLCPVGTMEGGLSFAVGDGAFAEQTGVLFAVKVGILAAIVIGAVFIYRIFCRFLCPLGAIYALFNRYALFGVVTDKTICTACGKCRDVCKADIHLPGDHECIACGDCVHHCPVKAIRRKKPFVKRKDDKK